MYILLNNLLVSLPSLLPLLHPGLPLCNLTSMEKSKCHGLMLAVVFFFFKWKRLRETRELAWILLTPGSEAFLTIHISANEQAFL